MRLLVLGGAGEVGRHIVMTADKSKAYHSIAVGERDVERAASLAAGCSERVTVHQLDITNEAALDASLADCDVVASCIGPYYKFGTRILSATIRAKKYYVDVCDDWQPTLDLLDLDEQAREAGVTCVIGMGASPGVSNLLAAEAHAALDTVHTLHTIWGIGDLNGAQMQEEDVSSPAALEHWLLQATGKIRVRARGIMEEVKPLTKRLVDFPGIGQVECRSLGHPEPVTLPLTFPDVRESLNLMNMPAPIIDALQRTAGELDRGVIEMPEAVARLERRLGEGEGLEAAFNGLRFLTHLVGDSIIGANYTPEVCAYAAGKKNNQPTRAGAWLDGYISGGTGGSTGVPAAVVLEMMAAGEIKHRGVLAPEGGIDSKTFFSRLEPLATRPAGSMDKPFLRVLVEPN